MTRQTSLYLDVVRFTAAMVVFIGHVSGQRFVGGLFWQLGAYMDEAVTVFFVLSGFVIAYVIDQREDDAERYAVARASRLYSVALPAILATVLLDHLGMAIRPDLYGESWGFSDRALLARRARRRVLREPPVVPGRRCRLHAAVLVALLRGLVLRHLRRAGLRPGALAGSGRGRAAAAGGAAYRRAAAGLAAGRGGLPGLCPGRPAGMGGLAALPGRGAGLPGLRPWTGGPGLHPLGDAGDLRDVADRSVGGLVFAAHLIGFNAVSHRFAAPLRAAARPIRWAAGATFTIYLFHVPIAQFLTTVVPWPPSAWATRAVMFGGTLVLMFAIAEVTERRKEPWRRAIAALVRAARGARPRVARVAPGAEGR